MHWSSHILRARLLEYSIKVNKGLCSWFLVGKGVRQGSPLSLYHIVISIEVLSCLLNRVDASDILPYHPC